MFDNILLDCQKVMVNACYNGINFMSTLNALYVMQRVCPNFVEDI